MGMFADFVCGRKKRCSLRTGHFHSDFLFFSRFLRSRMYLARFAFPSSELRWYRSLQEVLQNRWSSFRAKYQSWQKSHSRTDRNSPAAAKSCTKALFIQYTTLGESRAMPGIHQWNFQPDLWGYA